MQVCRIRKGVGLTERDIRDAQLKSKMIAAASSVVALIDASKYGQAYLSPFARANQIGHIFTDSQLAPRWIEALRSACPTLTLCNQDSVTNYTPCAAETHPYRIAFANLGENMPFSVDVRWGLERAAQAAGNIDLVVADNQLSGKVALQVAEHLSAKQPDLFIEYQIDEQVGRRIMEQYQQANIPVIAVDIPMVGATYFGVNHYQAGLAAGEALGQWVKQHWAGHIDWLILLTEPRAGVLPGSRIQGQLDGLQAVIGGVPTDRQLSLNSGNTWELQDESMHGSEFSVCQREPTVETRQCHILSRLCIPTMLVCQT